MVDFIIEAIPQAVSSIVYIAAVIILSQALFVFVPSRTIHSHKKVTVFAVATICALPSNLIYWLTFPDVFVYCVNFSFMQAEHCVNLPGYLLAGYQSLLLFLSYLVSQLCYDKLAKRLFEKVGFSHKALGDSE